MSTSKLLTVHCLALVLCLQAFQLIGQAPFVSGESVQSIDQNDPIAIVEVATALCEPTEGKVAQISRVSTIAKLVDYFDNEIRDEHRLNKCKQRHGEALHLLNDILVTSNDNACSTSKLDLIEKFHYQFVSTHEDDIQSRRDDNRSAAPLLLRLFFMHYAMQVDFVCKKSLINNLEWDLKEKFGADIADKLLEISNTGQQGDKTGAFQAIFHGAMDKFADMGSIKKYDDALMVWDLVENSYLSQTKKDSNGQESIKEEYDSITGEPIRMLIKVKEAQNLNMIKDQCHYNFKPIYSKLIMPIIRLANLGYSNTGEQFKVELEELGRNEHVKRWYNVVQLCEAMLPIKFYEDESMSLGSLAIISKDEAELLAKQAGDTSSNGSVAQEARQPIQYETDTNSMVGVDLIDSVVSQEARNFVDQIRTNLSARDRTMRRTMRHLMESFKQMFKSSFVGKFFISKKVTQAANEKENVFVQEDFGQQFGQALNNFNEEELLKMNGAGASKKGGSKTDDLVQVRSEAASSVEKKKSWSEIVSGWASVVASKLPTKMEALQIATGLFTVIFSIISASLLFMLTAG